MVNFLTPKVFKKAIFNRLPRVNEVKGLNRLELLLKRGNVEEAMEECYETLGRPLTLVELTIAENNSHLNLLMGLEEDGSDESNPFYGLIDVQQDFAEEYFDRHTTAKRLRF